MRIRIFCVLLFVYSFGTQQGANGGGNFSNPISGALSGLSGSLSGSTGALGSVGTGSGATGSIQGVGNALNTISGGGSGVGGAVNALTGSSGVGGAVNALTGSSGVSGAVNALTGSSGVSGAVNALTGSSGVGGAVNALTGSSGVSGAVNALTGGSGVSGAVNALTGSSGVSGAVNAFTGSSGVSGAVNALTGGSGVGGAVSALTGGSGVGGAVNALTGGSGVGGAVSALTGGSGVGGAVSALTGGSGVGGAVNALTGGSGVGGAVSALTGGSGVGGTVNALTGGSGVGGAVNALTGGSGVGGALSGLTGGGSGVGGALSGLTGGGSGVGGALSGLTGSGSGVGGALSGLTGGGSGVGGALSGLTGGGSGVGGALSGLTGSGGGSILGGLGGGSLGGLGGLMGGGGGSTSRAAACTKNTQFLCNYPDSSGQGEEPVFLIGANLPYVWSYQLGDFGDRKYWLLTMPDLTKYVIKLNLAGANTIRVFLHNEGQGSPLFAGGNVMNLDMFDSYLTELQDFIRFCHLNNIYVILVLWNGGHVEANHLKDMITSDSNTQSYIDNALKKMVQKLKDEPAVLAWDIINQPEGIMKKNVTDKNECWDNTYLEKKAPGRKIGWAGELVTPKEMQRFINKVAAAIRKEYKSTGFEPQITVSTYHIMTLTFQWQCKNLYNDYCLKASGGEDEGYLSLWSTQSFDEQGAAEFDVYSIFKKSYADYALGGHNTPPRPLIISEFTEERGRPHSEWTLEKQYDYLYKRGYSGGLTWNMMEQSKEPDSWPKQREAIRSMHGKRGTCPDLGSPQHEPGENIPGDLKDYLDMVYKAIKMVSKIATMVKKAMCTVTSVG